jgi:hypothetical protein
MKQKFNKYYIGIISIILIIGTSCNDLDQVPTDKFTDDTYWLSLIHISEPTRPY